MSLKGKVVLITGASAGIGAACADQFAAEGANLVLAARRQERLIALRDELQTRYEVSVAVIAADVRDKQALEAALQKLDPPFDEIKILVNNAGLVIGVDKAYATPAEDVDTMVDTNVKGVMNVIRSVVPGMLDRQQGHIINISSIAGHEAYPGGSVYCASKHAVNALTQSLRMDLVDTPLRVTAISPGHVDTEFSLVRFKGDAEKAAEVYAGMVPLSAEDIAEAIVFCASRPAHVQVADMIIFPSSQAAARIIHRE